MLAPLDLDLIQDTLRTTAGWIELIAIAVCFIAGWLVDRRTHLAADPESRLARISAGSINRLSFPVTTLVLLVVARAVFRHWHSPVFFPIFIPLVVALALIRLTIYAFRNVFGARVGVSERAVALAIWGALLLYYVGLLPEIASALDDVKVPLGKTEVSVLDLGRDAMFVVVAIALSLWASRLIERRLMRMSHLDNNLRVVLGKVFRALLILVGVLVALAFVGIDLTVLSVVGGAVGVGIGLGLQKLASNYIAGFTILLDRSIRVGDMVTVDGRFGAVTQVTSRYVVLRSLDGVEAIVPNETMITTTVLNHSYSSKEIKLGILVQVSYDSDLELAMRVLAEIGRSEERVLKRADIAPVVNIMRFAENGIDLELAVWINDPEGGQQNLKSALNLRLWKAFRENGIKIPFPQRDIRIIEQPTPGKSDPPPPT